MKRQVFPESTPLAEAQEIWAAQLRRLGVLQPLSGEPVPVDEAFGRITAEAVSARQSSPAYHGSAMDGVAVRFVDTFGATEKSPKRLKLGQDARYVDTGDPLPAGTDAVIMVEDIEHCAEDEIEIIAAATPYQHVRMVGEDLVATELIVPENHRIRSVDLGALLAGGLVEVPVRRKPRVMVIPTGTELVQPGDKGGRGKIIEFNSRILCAMIDEWGGEGLRHEIVHDDFDRLKDAISKAADRADMVVVNAGSSAGQEDFTVHALRELGEVFIQGVSIRPGKPTILGAVNGKPVVGIPGYPVSAALTLELFVRPWVYACQGCAPPPPEEVEATLARQVASTVGQEEFIRVKVGRVGAGLIATPVPRGAGSLMSLVRADGVLRVPAMSEGMGAGHKVCVALVRARSEIEQTIVCIGSHDNTLDILANCLKKRYPELSFSSAHVGSMAGLVAIKRGEAHLAGIHLLDEESGEYNTPFLRRLIPEKIMVLVTLVHRDQGLMVQRGNPKGISGFDDLKRKDVIFVNRQRGSGTRILTDKELKERNINSGAVQGYERDEYTHMGVAAAVASGAADTGLGILAAAKALGLEFIPVARERYDFAVPAAFFQSRSMARIMELLSEEGEFREMVTNLGGYDVSEMGKVVYRGGEEKR
ncbi:MAG: molybdopterin biosynthesis protein [bacterium]|nr:molybdopterin biosynthesis protein [bacterium]